MTTPDRDIHRLMLQVERGRLTFRQLTAMARETKIVLDLRSAELKRARAVLAGKKARKKR